MLLQLTPWAPFSAVKDKLAVASFMYDLGQNAVKTFKKGLAGPHSGRTYVRSGGRLHRASAAGEYPANDTGALNANIATEVNLKSMTIGTSMPYSGYLAYGTADMSYRKMSIDALTEAFRVTHFTRAHTTFKHGRR